MKYTSTLLVWPFWHFFLFLCKTWYFVSGYWSMVKSLKPSLSIEPWRVRSYHWYLMCWLDYCCHPNATEVKGNQRIVKKALKIFWLCVIWVNWLFQSHLLRLLLPVSGAEVWQTVSSRWMKKTLIKDKMASAEWNKYRKWCTCDDQISSIKF